MKMQNITLSNVFAKNGLYIDGDWIESKDQDPNGEVRIIQLADIGDGIFLNKSHRFLTKKKALQLKCTFLQKGDLLIARMPDPLGRACIFPGIERECVTVVDVCIIRPDSRDISNEFLKNLINSPDFRNKIIAYTTGTTRKRISRSNLDKIHFDLPAYDDQIRIATLLTRAEKLIAKRKESIMALDELLKSTFLEMFGEYLNKQEEIFEPIGTVTNFIDYRGKTQKRVENGIPHISAKCVRKGYFDESRLDFITEETYSRIMTRGFPKANDVLFTTEGATMGFVCRVPRSFSKFAVGQRIITLQTKENLIPEYLDYLLNHSSIQKEIFKRSSGSAAIGIRSSEFKEVKIPITPLPLQNQFATIVEKVEALKAKYTQSLTELENLYGSLSQRAFKGKLDLSKVPVEEEQIELHEEVIARSSMTDDLAASKIYSEAELIKTIQSLAGDIFSFDSLITALEKTSFEELPKYEELKQQIYKMLEGANPLLSQTFDRVKKEIALRVNV